MIMEPVLKKARIENTENDNLNNENKLSIDEEALNFSNFEMTRILNNLEDRCCVFVEGTFSGSSDKAVVALKKLPFAKDKLAEFFGKLANLKTLFKNDVYHNLMGTLPPELNEIKVDTIYPADEKHIKKFESHSFSFIDETPEIYENVVLPFIQTSSYSKQWIYNILEHKKEADRIVCEDMDPEIGFVMVPDMKWTGEQVESLYLQAIVMRRDIFSIRDLRGKHLPLLRNIYEKCCSAIKTKYGLPASKLRIYFHYQPSFYHLHVHFSAVSFEAPGTWIGQAHLLKDVISNIEIDPNFYQKVNLSFSVKDNHPLATLYKEYVNGKIDHSLVSETEHASNTPNEANRDVT